jgi:hypothetical protein
METVEWNEQSQGGKERDGRGLETQKESTKARFWVEHKEGAETRRVGNLVFFAIRITRKEI